jgi:hypothetical protein
LFVFVFGKQRQWGDRTKSNAKYDEDTVAHRLFVCLYYFPFTGRKRAHAGVSFVGISTFVKRLEEAAPRPALEFVYASFPG